jgi:hypothetical protein
MGKILCYIISVSFFANSCLFAQQAKDNYSSSSLLSSGKWIKIAVTNDGIYRLDYTDLVGLGLESPSDPVLFGNNKGQLSYYVTADFVDDLSEISIYMNKGADNVFNEGDYLLFYGQATGRWYFDYDSGNYGFTKHNYSDTSFYFLSSGIGTGKRVTTSTSVYPEPTYASSISDILYVRDVDEENIIKSGRQWFERLNANTPIYIDPGFDNLEVNEAIRYDITVVARSPASSFFKFSEETTVLNTLNVAQVDMSDYTGIQARIVDSSGIIVPSSANPTFNISFNPNSVLNAKGWLDKITLQGRRHNLYGGGTLITSDSRSVSPGEVTRFTFNCSETPFIWDISDPMNPSAIDFTVSGGDIYFDTATDSLKWFILFNGTGIQKPIIFGRTIQNQDLHGSPPAEMVIITHPIFAPFAEEIATLHYNNSGLTSLITTPEEIYNEFSGGIPDIVAIRNFLRMKYEKQKETETNLGYLLLLGDGSYDNRTLPPDNPNFIPTYQSQNSTHVVSSFTSDDFYTLLELGEGEAQGTEDIAVGRLPVNDTTEAGIVVRKIARYMYGMDQTDWKNVVCMVADDEDNNTHLIDAENLEKIITTEDRNIFVNKIYLDAYEQVTSSTGQTYPDATYAINQQINSGCLIFNYTGHGSESGLAAERVVKTEDISSWSNANRLPLFVTATCEFSRFDDADKNAITQTMIERKSAGEKVLLNENGGGIALMSTTRVAFSSLNYNLNRNIFSFAFDREGDGQSMRLGDIIRLAKINVGGDTNKRNFALLGDPALRIALPDDGRVITDSINHKHVYETTDTLKALSVVTVSGHIEKNSGMPFNEFNGLLSPVVYDKPSNISTLGNDGETTVSFQKMDNIIFKGNCEVKDGKFEFSFLVPREINYEYGNGKIRYYAFDGENDIAGSFDEIVVGGFSLIAVRDTVGPDIQLFMNDTLFRNGGITGPLPTLVARLEDPSGINSSGFAIGHDIVAEIDKDPDKIFVLNNYFETDQGSYTRGSINYQLMDLTDGRHTLTLKAWDNLNNSNRQSISFLVKTEEGFLINNPKNYPNPVTSSTKFTLEHNRPGRLMHVTIRIFDGAGKLVKTIETERVSFGYQLPDIEWDCRNGYGQRVSKGIYIYSIDIETDTGEKARESGRIMIL